MLANLIAQHASAEAAADDWAKVAAIVRGLGLRSPPRKCGSVETAVALAAVGVNWAAVMDVIDDDATGRFILTMLASEGVQWGHALTVPYLRSKQGAVLTEAGVDALVNLSAPLVWSSLTAEGCRDLVVFKRESAKRQGWQERFDAALNTLGTAEQSAGIAAIRAIADEMEEG
jgi:hypothetical protein